MVVTQGMNTGNFPGTAGSPILQAITQGQESQSHSRAVAHKPNFTSESPGSLLGNTDAWTHPLSF